MKKIFAILITLTMLLSLGTVFASAEELPDVLWTSGNYAVADPADFSTVGTVKIQWDKDAATKLDLTDGFMADWTAAGYQSVTIDASNMVSWVGGAADATADKGCASVCGLGAATVLAAVAAAFVLKKKD